MNKIYAAIDLKSFYASVECREKGLDKEKWKYQIIHLLENLLTI